MEQATKLFNAGVLPAVMLHNKSEDNDKVKSSFVLQINDYYVYFNDADDYFWVQESYDEEELSLRTEKRLALCLGYPPISGKFFDELKQEDCKDRVYINYHGIQFTAFEKSIPLALEQCADLYNIPPELKTKITIKFPKHVHSWN